MYLQVYRVYSKLLAPGPIKRSGNGSDCNKKVYIMYICDRITLYDPSI